MSCAAVHVSLLFAPDDPPIDDGALQSTLDKFRRFLQYTAVPVVTPMFHRDDESEVVANGYVGEFIVPLPQTRLPPLGTIVAAWLEQRPERAVRLRVGESRAVARSIDEVENFLRRARRLRAGPDLDHSESVAPMDFWPRFARTGGLVFRRAVAAVYPFGMLAQVGTAQQFGVG